MSKNKHSRARFSVSYPRFLLPLAAVCVSLTGVPLAQGSEASRLDFKGFLDLNFRAGRDSATPGIQDAALYFEHSFAQTRLFLDLPFKLRTGSSDLAAFENQAQAFIHHRYQGGLEWTLGQFDGLFGLERNDTAALRFSSHGALYETQPRTQLGLWVRKEWAADLQLDLFAGGAENAGSTEIGSRPELGGRVRWGSDFKLSVGGTFRQMAANVARAYGNLTLEKTGTLGSAAVQVSAAKAGTGSLAFGVGSLLDYSLSERTRVGTRAELVRKFSDDQKILLTVGPQHQMNEHVTLKLDYTLDSTRATASAKTLQTHLAGFSAIYSF